MMQGKVRRKAECSGAKEGRNVQEDLGDSWVRRKVRRCE